MRYELADYEWIANADALDCRARVCALSRLSCRISRDNFGLSGLKRNSPPAAEFDREMEDVMTLIRRRWSEQEQTIRRMAGKRSRKATARPKVPIVTPRIKFSDHEPDALTAASSAETVVAPSAIERALSIYQLLHHRDQSVVLQARRILTQYIYGLVDQGEHDERRLTVGGLAHLKAIERDHTIKSAYDVASTTVGRPKRPCAPEL